MVELLAVSRAVLPTVSRMRPTLVRQPFHRVLLATLRSCRRKRRATRAEYGEA